MHFYILFFVIFSQTTFPSACLQWQFSYLASNYTKCCARVYNWKYGPAIKLKKFAVPMVQLKISVLIDWCGVMQLNMHEILTSSMFMFIRCESIMLVIKMEHFALISCIFHHRIIIWNPVVFPRREILWGLCLQHWKRFNAGVSVRSCVIQVPQTFWLSNFCTLNSPGRNLHTANNEGLSHRMCGDSVQTLSYRNSVHFRVYGYCDK